MMDASKVVWRAFWTRQGQKTENAKIAVSIYIAIPGRKVWVWTRILRKKNMTLPL